MWILVDDTDTIINVIVWDGKTEIGLPPHIRAIDYRGDISPSIGDKWDGNNPIVTPKLPSNQPISIGTETLGSKTKVV